MSLKHQRGFHRQQPYLCEELPAHFNQPDPPKRGLAKLRVPRAPGCGEDVGSAGRLQAGLRPGWALQHMSAAPGPPSSTGLLWTGSHVGLQVPWALAPHRIPSKWVSASPHAAGTRLPVKVVPRAAAGDAAGDQSSWTKKTSSSCRDPNLLFSLCRQQPSASPLAVAPHRGLTPMPAEPPAVSPLGCPGCHRRSWLSPAGGGQGGRGASGAQGWPCQALGELCPRQGRADRYL